jgi:hypothetical protein
MKTPNSGKETKYESIEMNCIKAQNKPVSEKRHSNSDRRLKRNRHNKGRNWNSLNQHD